MHVTESRRDKEEEKMGRQIGQGEMSVGRRQERAGCQCDGWGRNTLGKKAEPHEEGEPGMAKALTETSQPTCPLSSAVHQPSALWLKWKL